MKRIIFSLFTLCTLTATAQTPLTLQKCIERATKHNIQVRQALVAREQQAVQLKMANNARLPEVRASAGENLSFGRGLTANNTYEMRNTSSTNFSVGASMPLYTGNRIKHEQQRSSLNLEAATADIERLREDLALQITQIYLQVIYQADLVQQAHENLAIAQRQEERVRKTIAAGKMAEVELAEQTSRIAQDELALVQANNNYRLALLDLSQLLELPSPDSLSIARPDESELQRIVGNPEEIYLLSRNDRPTLRAADLRIKAANCNISIAKAGYLPSLSLNAGIGTSYYNSSGISNIGFGKQLKDNLSQSIGLNLSIPIFDRHSTRHNVTLAKLELANQQLQREGEEKKLYKEIQNAYYNALAAEQKYKAAVVAAKSAQTALNTITLKFENGKANSTEFDEARHKYQLATTDRLAARYEFLFRSKILNFYRGQTLQ